MGGNVTMKRIAPAALAASMILVFAAQAAAAPSFSADYRFLRTRTTSAGTPPALVDLVGGGNSANAFAKETVDGSAHTVLTFPAGNGLVLSPTTGVMGNATYTIVVLFRFATVGQWDRIIDFKDGTADSGLYINPANGLTFYPIANGATTVSADQWIQVALTRDGTTGTMTGYLDGAQQFSVSDTDGLGVIDSSNVLRLFQDNTSGSATGEQSAGAVERIRISASVLSAQQIAALDRVPPKQKVTLGATSGAAGSTLNVTGRNFGPQENVKLAFIDSTGAKFALGSVTTDVSGAFGKTVVVPNAATGAAKVRATGVTSTLLATAAFTVSG